MARGLTLRGQRKEETRSRILEAAYRVFARRGYEAATVDEITTECGIAKGALYIHFASKEDLFRTILVEHVRRRVAETAARLEPELPLRESILRIIEASWGTCRTDPIWSPLFMEIWALAGRNEWGREAVAALFDHCSAALAKFLSGAKRAGLVRSDLDVHRAARLLLAVNDGLVLQWQTQPDKVDPEEFLGPMADMITGYLTAQSQGVSEAEVRTKEQALTVTEYRHPEALATTEWLAAHLNDPSVRVLDMRYSVGVASGGSFRGVSGKKAYHQGHIPGALFVDPVSDLADPEHPLNILSPARFEALMGRLGIGSRSTVVVYDDSGGTWAARLWWALRYYGHDAAKVLNGGLTKWTAEGRRLETRTPAPAAATFGARVRPALRATCDEVRQAIERRDVCIVDALPEPFYTGQARLYPNHRAGHIPTARNLPATANIDLATQTLLPAGELARLWRKVGLKPDQRVITYCGAGVYGAYDLFVLYVLGHKKVSLYDASWMEWGANADLPVETGSGDRTLDSN